MIYELGYRSGIPLGGEVKSLEFDVLTQSFAPETLAVDSGSLIVNGVPVASPTPVRLDDKVQIVATAPDDLGEPKFINLTQAGELVGTFVVISEPEAGNVYDPQYLDLEPYEVLPSSEWTPGPDRQLFILDGNDLSISETIPLTDTQMFDVPRYAVHVNDYHRDLTYVIDAATEEFKGVIPSAYDGPVSDATIYSSEGRRKGLAVAYRKSNKVAIFNEAYVLIDSILSTDPVKVVTNENILFLLEKGADFIRRFEFNTSLGYTETRLNFANPIQDFVAFEGEVAVVMGNKLIDFDGTQYPSMRKRGYTVFYESVSDVIAVSHGLEGGQTYFKGAVGERTSILGNTPMLYHSHTTYKRKGTPNVVYLGDNDNKLYSENLQNNPGSITHHLDLPGPAYGAATFGNSIFVPNLHEGIDKKVVTFDREAEVLDFGQAQLGYVSESVDSTSVTISGINTPTPIYVPVLTTQKIELVVNGEVQPSPHLVINDDVVLIRATTRKETGESELIPVVIGQALYKFSLLPNEPYRLPRNTKFLPITIDNTDTDFLTPPNLINDLGSGVTQEVTVDNGFLVLNGVLANKAKTQTVEDGDTLQVLLTSGDSPCSQTFANVNYGDRFTSQFRMIVRDPGSGTLDDPEDPRIEPVAVSLDYGEPDPLDIMSTVTNVKLGQSVYSSGATVVLSDTGAEVDVTIPDIYNSFLVINGTQSETHTAKVKHGDVIQVGLKTTYNYFTDHLLPIMFCGRTFYFIGKTIPDFVPDNFYFGFQSGLHMTDKVLSDEVTVSGLMSGVVVPLVIPYGTVPIINGQRIVLHPVLVDYRGMLIRPYATTVKNGDKIQLEGYPRPIYGTKNDLTVSIGYRTGVWELETLATDGPTLVDDVNYNVDNHTSAESYFVEPVFADIERNTAIVSTSTRPVKVPRVDAFIVAKSNRVLAPKPKIIASSVKTVYIETPKTAVVRSSKQISVSKPKSAIVSRSTQVVLNKEATKALVRKSSSVVSDDILDYVASSNSSIELYGKRDKATPIPNTHVEMFEHQGWIKGVGSSSRAAFAPNSTEKSYIVNKVSFAISNSKPTFIKSQSTKHVKFASGIWIKDEVRAPVKAKDTSTLSATVFPVKAPVLFNGSFIKAAAPATVKGSRPSEWLRDNNSHVLAPKAEALVAKSSGKAYVDHSFIVNVVKPVIATRGSFKLNGTRTIPIKSERIFKVAKPTNVAAFQGSFIPAKSSAPKMFKMDSAVIPAANPVLWKTNAVVAARSSNVKFSSPGTAVFNAPKPVYFGSTLDTDFSTHSKSHLAGTFETKEDATANALELGVVEGTFSVVEYEDRFIWIRIIPCENMCNACPPTGYIRGG